MPKYANIFWITMAAVPTNLIVLMVTYNSDRAKLGSDTKRGVSYNCWISGYWALIPKGNAEDK